MLSINDVVKDFDAICDRVDRDGTPKPPFVSTVADNLVDLGWHQKEFELRRSFAYTVVAPDDSQVLGCVYINPSETHDAHVWMWVRRAAWEEGLDPLLEGTLRDWLAREWTFQDWTAEPHGYADGRQVSRTGVWPVKTTGGAGTLARGL